MAKVAKQFDIENSSNSKDRISGLPDPLLHHILSFLPSTNVVQSCLLSKRWTDLWCSIPFLNFEHNQCNEDKITHAIKFIDSVFHRRDGSDVQSLRLRLHLSWTSMFRSFKTSVDSWIIFVLRHNVRVLDIRLSYPLELTPHLFTSTTLRVLKLSGCLDLRMLKSVCLPMLEMLSLDAIAVDNDSLSKLISSCPSLTTLIVHESEYSTEVLTISNQHLESLVFESFFKSTKIHAPRLTSLKFKSCYMSTFDIDDCPLVDANIEMTPYSSEAMEVILKALNSVESLELSQGFISAYYNLFLVKVGQHILECPFNNVKFLKFTTSFRNAEVHAVNSLLRFSPNIETIVLKNVTSKERQCITTEKLGFDYELSHLRFVKFQNFQGLKNEVKFVEFFSMKATSLMKLYITISDRLKDPESKELLADISKKLLKSPRVSTICITAARKELISVFV